MYILLDAPYMTSATSYLFDRSSTAVVFAAMQAPHITEDGVFAGPAEELALMVVKV